MWCCGRAMQSSGLEHALAIYSDGGAAALLLGALALAAWGVERPGGAQSALRTAGAAVRVVQVVWPWRA